MMIICWPWSCSFPGQESDSGLSLLDAGGGGGSGGGSGSGGGGGGLLFGLGQRFSL